MVINKFKEAKGGIKPIIDRLLAYESLLAVVAGVANHSLRMK